jgi:hypothetical protein
MKPSKKWRRQSEVYLVFARQCSDLDSSERAAQEMFEAESTGAKHDLTRNAYAVGKHWANVQVEEWKQGIAEGLFLKEEFLEDADIPRWWTEEVLKVCPVYGSAYADAGRP